MDSEQKGLSFDLETVPVNYSFIDRIYDGAFREPIDRWTLLLPGSGCEWARKKHKGCTFCAFNARIDELTGGVLLPAEEMFRVFEAAVKKIGLSKPRLMSVFNGGNFINDREIVPEAQMEILRFTADHPSIERVLFEAKIEYLSNRKLEACLKAIGSKILRVGIGLESKDDHLRNNVINKGLSKDAYERTIKRLTTLGIEVQTYVFMKPMTITERAAIEEAVDTVKYAVDCGSSVVMLEAAMVQKGTPFEDAYRRGEFESPRLWSLKEVVDRVADLPQFNVGIFDEEPRPISFPRNCDHCTDRFNKAFRHFRETRDRSELNALACPCETEWRKIAS